MTDKPVREPEQIRRDCAQKLRSVETSGMFNAILACLLNEDWTEPRIEELRLTPDRCLLARVAGDATFKTFIGAEADLIRNIHGVAKHRRIGWRRDRLPGRGSGTAQTD